MNNYTNYSPYNNHSDPTNTHPETGFIIALYEDRPLSSPTIGACHQEALISLDNGGYTIASQDCDVQTNTVKGMYCMPIDKATGLEWLLAHPQSSNHFEFTSEGTKFMASSRWAAEYRRSLQPSDCPDGSVRITASIDEDLFRLLDLQAARWDLTHTQTIRRIIKETVERRDDTTHEKASGYANHLNEPVIVHNTNRRLCEPPKDAVPLAHYYGENLHSTWHDETLFRTPDGRYVLENGTGMNHALILPDNWKYTELTEREAFDWMNRQTSLRSDTTWSTEAMALIHSKELNQQLARTPNPLDPDTAIIQRNVFLDMNTELPKFDRYAFQRNLYMDTALSVILAEALM